ncbi:MAG: hypothetical protein AABZ39_10850 [Spirochaetota bacterium]
MLSSVTARTALFILTILSFTVIAADRIVLENNEIIECTVLSQTKDTVTYEKNGQSTTIEKSQIKKLELDTEVDKYYRAARETSDNAKRILYLEKSVAQFPNSGTNRLFLVKTYLSMGSVEKADAAASGGGNESRLAQGLVRLKEGRPRAAARHLASVDVTRIDPSDAACRDIALSIARALSGKLDGARAALIDAGKRDTADDGLAILTKGVSISEYDNALSQLETSAAAKRPIATNSMVRFAAGTSSPGEKFLQNLRDDAREDNKRYDLCFEAGGGNLITILFDWRFLAPFSAGAAVGFDYGQEQTNGLFIDQYLFNGSVYGSWEFLKADYFSLETRLHFGVSFLYLAPSTYGSFALELTPSIIAVSTINVYLIVSSIFMLTLSDVSFAWVPQIGLGYRLSF